MARVVYSDREGGSIAGQCRQNSERKSKSNANPRPEKSLVVDCDNNPNAETVTQSKIID